MTMPMNPEKRKKEILKTAEELFQKNGYEKTPVSKIVEKAGIAKGTFYYYFDSKKDLLEEMAGEYIRDIGKKLTDLEKDPKLKPAEKFIETMRVFKDSQVGREEVVEYLHEQKNVLLHEKLAKKTVLMLIPFYTRLIKQGCDDGDFHVEDPETASVAIIGTFMVLEYSEDSQPHHKFKIEDEKDAEKLMALLSIYEKILGTKENTFRDIVEERILI